MSVGDTLYAISDAGLTMSVSKTEDTLKVYPAENNTRELAAAIKVHKAEIIRIVREDEEMRPTGCIQSERPILEMASDYFGLDKRRGAA